MNIITNIISWAITAILGFIISTIFHNRNLIRLYYQSIIRWNKEIRVSYAYLFKIRYKGKYLLIKGNRINQLQPIGGVYKYYDSFTNKKNELEIRDEKSDNFYETGDLRQIIKGKYLVKFLRWFLSDNNRQVMVWRELLEELNIDDTLSKEIILSTEIEYLNTVTEKIKFSEHFKIDEQKIFKIYEARIPEKFLETIINNDNFCLVEANDIDRLDVIKNGLSVNISETSRYIL
ncbi:hypothetical protein [Mycoplasma simbae]|uniref:SMODS-associated NUDIX domain-containing protein n=1 Tax=Mycoplasma simbae TaxID=36744 RepID=UPI00049760C2|nr:hypothetical protein [Mycoplasma simbae]